MLNKNYIAKAFTFIAMIIMKLNAFPPEITTPSETSSHNQQEQEIINMDDMKEAFPYLFPREEGNEIDLKTFEFWKDTAAVELLIAFLEININDQTRVWMDINKIAISLLKGPTITYKRKADISSNMASFYYSLLKREDFRGWAFPMTADYLFFFYIANLYGDSSSRKIFKTEHLKLLNSINNKELKNLLSSYSVTNHNDQYLTITPDAIDFLHNLFKNNQTTTEYQGSLAAVELYKIKIIEKYYEIEMQSN